MIFKIVNLILLVWLVVITLRLEDKIDKSLTRHETIVESIMSSNDLKALFVESDGDVVGR